MKIIYNKSLQLWYFKHKNATQYARQLVFTGTDEDSGRRNIVLLCLKRYYEGKLLRRNIVLSRPERCNERNFVRRHIFLFCQSKNKSWIYRGSSREELNQQEWSVVPLAQISSFYSNKYIFIPKQISVFSSQKWPFCWRIYINIFLSKQQELEGGAESTEIICCPSLTKAACGI